VRRPAARLLPEPLELGVVPGEILHLVGDKASISAIRGALASRDTSSVRLGSALPKDVLPEALIPYEGSGRRTPRAVVEAAGGFAEEILTEVGLPTSTWDVRSRRLSGEQRWALGLGLLLAQPPALLLADLGPREASGGPDQDGTPGSALSYIDSPDPQTHERVLASVRSSGTVIVSCHGGMPAHLGEAERALVVCGGRIVEELRGVATAEHPWVQGRVEKFPLAHAWPPEGDVGCPARTDCPRAQPRCAASLPPLAARLGGTHPMACWFPDRGRVGLLDLSVASPEPTAHEFAHG
jgi:hypothetical protein